MSLLEDVKRITEKATGWKRPDDPRELPRERKPRTYWFKHDGLIPNHPKWPLVIYKSAVRLPDNLDPAAVFEDLFESNGWRDSWRDGIYDYAHYHSRIHEVLGVARGSGRVQFGGPKGRRLILKAGDVAILPAGTGHQCLKASKDFLVIGAYPPAGTFDICTTPDDRKKALVTIPKVARPHKDPVYGAKGALLHTWCKPTQRKSATKRRQARVLLPLEAASNRVGADHENSHRRGTGAPDEEYAAGLRDARARPIRLRPSCRARRQRPFLNPQGWGPLIHLWAMAAPRDLAKISE